MDVSTGHHHLATRHSILVICNDTRMLFATSQLLEKNRYQVTLALNGCSGIDFIRSSSFSLVLCEFPLEDTTGMTVVEAVRNISPQTMVMLGINAVDAALKPEIFKLGADDYIFRPYELEELLFRVRQNIEHYELKQKIAFQRNYVTGCCLCKKIRFDDKGDVPGGWMEVEDFLKEKMNILLSSTYCPKCAQTVQEDLMVQLDRMRASKSSRI